MIDPREFYRGVADADAYFASQLWADDWVGANETDKEKALLAASRAVDSLQYLGLKVPVYNLTQQDGFDVTADQIAAAEESQILQFPRIVVTSANALLQTPTVVLSGESWSLEIVATGGTFALTLNGELTGPIAWDAVAGDILTALEALPSVDAGDVTVGTDGAKFVISMTSQTLNASLSADPALLTSTTQSATSATVLTLNDNVPDPVFWAVCEEAKQLLSARDPEQEFNNLWLTTDGVGSTRASFDRTGMPAEHTSALLLSALGFKYLQRYLEPNNTFEVRRS